MAVTFLLLVAWLGVLGGMFVVFLGVCRELVRLLMALGKVLARWGL